MKHNFCTVTDKNFTCKCLALFNSIERHMPGSTLWVLCLDDESRALFGKLAKKNIITVSVTDFHDKALEATRSSRTMREFAWTCKPAIMDYLLHQKMLETLVFVDSDLLFYSSLDRVFEAHKEAAVMITSHKFTEKKKYLADRIGYFNSGFIVFRNGEIARACTSRYKAQCLDWCHNYFDKGRFGDQPYLSDWPRDFEKIEDIPEKGVNLGTWNLKRYKITEKGGLFYVDDELLVCYHFHGLICYIKGAKIRPYPITVHHGKIYKSYLRALQVAYDDIIKKNPSWDHGFAPKPSLPRFIKQAVTGLIRNSWP